MRELIWIWPCYFRFWMAGCCSAMQALLSNMFFYVIDWFLRHSCLIIWCWFVTCRFVFVNKSHAYFILCWFMSKPALVWQQRFGVGVSMLFMYSCLHFVGQCLGVGSAFVITIFPWNHSTSPSGCNQVDGLPPALIVLGRSGCSNPFRQTNVASYVFTWLRTIKCGHNQRHLRPAVNRQPGYSRVDSQSGYKIQIAKKKTQQRI